MKKDNIILLISFLLIFSACDVKREKPSIVSKNKIYKPSEDSTNVFRHIYLYDAEWPDLVKPHMLQIDSLYRIGNFKNFIDKKYEIYNKNRSLDSLITIYNNIYGKPFFRGKVQRSEFSCLEKEITLNYLYNKDYILVIIIRFRDSINYQNYNKIRTDKVRNFAWFPYLYNIDRYSLRKIEQKKDKNRHWSQINRNGYKGNKALDSMYRILNPDKNK